MYSVLTNKPESNPIARGRIPIPLTLVCFCAAWCCVSVFFLFYSDVTYLTWQPRSHICTLHRYKYSKGYCFNKQSTLISSYPLAFTLPSFLRYMLRMNIRGFSGFPTIGWIAMMWPGDQQRSTTKEKKKKKKKATRLECIHCKYDGQ